MAWVYILRGSTRRHYIGVGEAGDADTEVFSTSGIVAGYVVDFVIWRSAIRKVASKARSDKMRRMNRIVPAPPPMG
jgi:hypothetical protein